MPNAGRVVDGKAQARHLRVKALHFGEFHGAVVDEDRRLRSDVPCLKNATDGRGFSAPIGFDRKNGSGGQQDVGPFEASVTRSSSFFEATPTRTPLSARAASIFWYTPWAREWPARSHLTPCTPTSPRMPFQTVSSRSVIRPFLGGRISQIDDEARESVRVTQR